MILVPEEDSRLTIKPEVLRQMIDQVAFAAATDGSRPVLTGVLAEVADGKLTLAAADGYRLSVRPVGLEDADERTISVIIPARALQKLRRIAGEQDQPVEMLIAPSRNQVFHMHDVDLVSQLVEGAFPDYRQIIPSNHTTRTIVNAADFLKAVRMAFIFARDANIVRLQIIPGADGGPARLLVTATSAEHGDNVSELDAGVEELHRDRLQRALPHRGSGGRRHAGRLPRDARSLQPRRHPPGERQRVRARHHAHVYGALGLGCTSGTSR